MRCGVLCVVMRWVRCAGRAVRAWRVGAVCVREGRVCAGRGSGAGVCGEGVRVWLRGGASARLRVCSLWMSACGVRVRVCALCHVSGAWRACLVVSWVSCVVACVCV